MQIISAVKAPLSALLRHASVRNHKWKKKNPSQIIVFLKVSASWKVIIYAEERQSRNIVSSASVPYHIIERGKVFCVCLCVIGQQIAGNSV